MIMNNEEKNLARTLEGLRWADEVVIVDSGSTDNGPDIARAFGANFSFNLDFRGHAEQKNVAIRKCQHEWILLLDADEVVTPELTREIQAALSDPAQDAYWIPRLNLFLTRWMRHGGLYPDTKLRLFRRGVAWVEEGVGPHGTPQYSRHKAILKHHLVHYGYPDFRMYLSHMNDYSSDGAHAAVPNFRRTSSAALLARAFLNPLFAFIKNYFFRFGFLDGIEGLIFHFNHSVYVHWKYIKIWEERATPRA
jgi:glycosyltransferase involved in cell wall biosynthesis